MKFDWSYLEPSQMRVYRELCPENEYRVYELNFELPGISKGLTDQISTVMIAASGDGNGRVYYMANLHRPDPKDSKGRAIDQMPFGFIFDNYVPMLSGALVQHGDWTDRTTYPPTSAWQDVVGGKIQAYVDLKIFPPSQTGSIYDLDGSTQQAAFSTLISGLSSQAAKFVEETKLSERFRTSSDTEKAESKSPKSHQDETPASPISYQSLGTFE
jgi:hypothetical protein